MKFDKRQLQVMLLVLICMVVYTSWCIQNNKKEDYTAGIIRFHVLANSDSKEDQELKLKVRDGVLEAVNTKLVKETIKKYETKEPEKESESVKTMAETCEETTQEVSLNVDESREYLQGNLDLIEKIAENIIKENGYNYDVTAELGIRWIPKKTYGSMTFPAGNYEALNITIGEGEGNNWWCVLFPPLCLIDGSDNPNIAETFESTTYPAIGMTEDLMKLRQDNKNNVTTQTAIKLKFKTLELLENMNLQNQNP